VYQYTLSTAWDIATATYANKSFSVAGQETNPTGVFFKPDGLTMYVIGQTNNTVYQYTLSTAWDIATATYANKSFSVAGQETNPTGVFFKPDGLTMYVIGQTNNTVYQYTLSTAWDIATVTYANKSFSVATQDAAPRGVFFKPDGTTMYVIGQTNNTVYQYTLFTTLNYTAVSTAIAALSQPSSSYIALQEEDVDVITINTNLQAFISRDGGTTFTQATLAEVVNLGVQRILTATIDLTAQPAGTSMVYKLVASGDKKLLVHATSLQWN
jgi:DNA-binding beta-propeller fold protein YncE